MKARLGAIALMQRCEGMVSSHRGARATSSLMPFGRLVESLWSRGALPKLDLDVRRRGEAKQVARQCAQYRYRAPEDNALYPVAAAESFDLRRVLGLAA